MRNNGNPKHSVMAKLQEGVKETNKKASEMVSPGKFRLIIEFGVWKQGQHTVVLFLGRGFI